eukprot:scaffold7641_cov115-Cylindrotheca_fusiformis.AAC.13
MPHPLWEWRACNLEAIAYYLILVHSLSETASQASGSWISWRIFYSHFKLAPKIEGPKLPPEPVAAGSHGEFSTTI